jgi:hypothetical protein
MLFGWVSTFHVLFACIVACAALAAWKGGSAERIGAGANLLAAVCFSVAQQVVGNAAFAMPALILDGLLAFTFLALTLRFATPWLGVAMLLQAAQFSLHAYYFVVKREPDLLFAVVNNVVSWGLLASILSGVALAWRAQVRRAGAQPSR